MATLHSKRREPSLGMRTCSPLTPSEAAKGDDAVSLTAPNDGAARHNVFNGVRCMKFLICVLVTLMATGWIAGCSSGSTAPAATTPPPAAKVTGLDTPKSVSVVTAN